MESHNFAILIIFVISFAISFLAVALMLKLSHANKWYDKIDHRKVHDGEVPRLGGIGFAAAFFIAAVAISIFYREADMDILPCLLALLLILIFGVFDDFRSLKPHFKLLVQFIAALIVILPGYYFRNIFNFSDGILYVQQNWIVMLKYIVTLLWFIGITNAINLIDGIDGLAAGISGLIALFFGLIFFYYSSNPIFILFCAAFAGVILGFLFFNAPFPKAKIFMGDCGSQFLGFFLALLPLLPRLEPQITRAALPIPYAAALLLIPILDTIAAVWRRVRDGISIHTADKSHVHHKLLKLGFSVKGVNALLYGLQIIIGVLVFISIRLEGLSSLYVLCSVYLISIVFFIIIHFCYRAIIKKEKVIE